MSDPNALRPNSEGTLYRVQLVSNVAGTLIYPEGERSTNGTVIDENGDRHRVQLVYDVGMDGGKGMDDRIIIKSDTIPTANADSYGKFYCFSGPTNNAYTHGYIYQCIADESTEYIIALNPESGESIHKIGFDYENHSPIELFERIASLSTPVFNPADVKSGTFRLDKVNELWYISGYDASNNMLFEDFTIAGTGDEYSLDAYGFVYIDHFPDNFEDGYTETYQLISNTVYSNYRWERMDVQPAAAVGRYLSNWNAATGLAATNPQNSPYEYKAGDYFIVGTVASSGSTNYKPNGSSYVIGQASTTVESSPLNINDMYLYDGSNWLLLKTGSTVTSVNGQVGDVTVQETLVNQTNIKSVNGNSLLGSGNLEIGALLNYPESWPTTSSTTTKAFCDVVAADTTAVEGKMYLGEVRWSYLPSSLVNAECVVEIMKGTTSSNKVIVLTLTSGNTSPYMWKYTYWNGGSNVSGWIGFQPELPTQSGQSGKFLTTDGSTLSWGSVDALPSQTGQNGKVLTTNGTTASWETPTTITMRTWGANE